MRYVERKVLDSMAPIRVGDRVVLHPKTGFHSDLDGSEATVSGKVRATNNRTLYGVNNIGFYGETNRCAASWFEGNELEKIL